MALKGNRRLTIERKPDEATAGETQEQSPSRLGMAQTAQAESFIRKSVRGAGSWRKPDVMQTGITGRYGRRRKPTAGITGISREDKFQVSRRSIIGGSRTRNTASAGDCVLVQPKDSDSDGCRGLAVSGASRGTHETGETQGMVASLAGD